MEMVYSLSETKAALSEEPEQEPFISPKKAACKMLRASPSKVIPYCRGMELQALLLEKLRKLAPEPLIREALEGPRLVPHLQELVLPDPELRELAPPP
jgi:hypothetical protein